MNLNYDKIKHRMEDGGHQWTSYSDLFLVLSVVFLLLYVIANIRIGTMTMAQQTQLMQAKAEAENLKKQIKAYDVLSEDYLKQGASSDEIQVYRDLTDHIDLLAGDAKKERDEAARKAKEADDKARSLNGYQQMVKNIINANLVASGKMKKRDMTIEGQDKDIENLTQSVQSKEGEIARNNQTIEKIQTNLEKQIQETRYAYRSKKNSKEKMERDIKRLQDQSQQQIATLQAQTSQTETQLAQTRSKLKEKSHQAEQLMSTLTAKESQYKNSVASLKSAHDEEITRARAAFDKSMNELKLSAQERVDQERAYAESEQRKNESYQAKLASINGDLERTRAGIKDIEGKYQNSLKSMEAQSNAKLASLEAQSNAKLAAKDRENLGLQGAIAEMKHNHDSEMARERGAFEKSMRDLKLSGDEKLAREHAFAAGEAQKNAEYQGQLAGMSGDLQRTKQGMQSLQQSNMALQSDLQKSQQMLYAQRMLADQIKKNFGKAGINASVDGKTGDVMINFGGEYFDSGSSDLKTGMKAILEKTFPVYAKSLLENPKVAERISSVEIVGFASPTYQGRSVDPNSLSAENREAVNYNMDLSYQRAKSIFQHVFDTSKMQFNHQTQLLPLVKVSGRSYLSSDRIPGRNPADVAKGADYCSIFNCKTSQKVIIKFNLREE